MYAAGVPLREATNEGHITGRESRFMLSVPLEKEGEGGTAGRSAAEGVEG